MFCPKPEHARIGEMLLAAEFGSGHGDGIEDSGVEALQLFVAQGAVGGLEGGAEQQGVLAGIELGIVEDLAGAPVDELGEVESGQGEVDLFPGNALVEHEGEVPTDGLEA